MARVSKHTNQPTGKHYSVTVNLLVFANNEEEAQANALSSLGYARRLLDCPLGAQVENVKILIGGHKQWMEETDCTPFDLVVTKNSKPNI